MAVDAFELYPINFATPRTSVFVDSEYSDRLAGWADGSKGLFGGGNCGAGDGRGSDDKTGFLDFEDEGVGVGVGGGDVVD